MVQHPPHSRYELHKRTLLHPFRQSLVADVVALGATQDLNRIVAGDFTPTVKCAHQRPQYRRQDNDGSGLDAIMHPWTMSRASSYIENARLSLSVPITPVGESRIPLIRPAKRALRLATDGAR